MKEIINITFPDGKSHEERKGITGFEIAEKISKSVAKEAIAFKVNDEIQDLSHCIEKDAQVEIIKKDNVAALEIIRHDCAHIMAEAVQALFPNTQVTIGPAIENGFYYDFAKEEPFTVNDFDKIEKKMLEIIDQGKNFTREVWTRDQAINFFSKRFSTFSTRLHENLLQIFLRQTAVN